MIIKTLYCGSNWQSIAAQKHTNTAEAAINPMVPIHASRIFFRDFHLLLKPEPSSLVSYDPNADNATVHKTFKRHRPWGLHSL
jgi:hypothetical protein